MSLLQGLLNIAEEEEAMWECGTYLLLFIIQIIAIYGTGCQTILTIPDQYIYLTWECIWGGYNYSKPYGRLYLDIGIYGREEAILIRLMENDMGKEEVRAWGNIALLYLGKAITMLL